jgi:hypothetical protein
MSTNAKDMPIMKLESPRFEDSRPLLVAGLAGRYTASVVSPKRLELFFPPFS